MEEGRGVPVGVRPSRISVLVITTEYKRAATYICKFKKGKGKCHDGRKKEERTGAKVSID